MSDEPAQDVSPLRLKRPGAAVPTNSGPVTPVVPTPVPPVEVESVAPAAVQPNTLRRRPTLSTTEEPGSSVNFESSLNEIPALAPPGPPAPVKLRVGVKSPAPFPFPGTSAPSPASDLFPPVTGAPLLPLPGMPEMPMLQAIPVEFTGGLTPPPPPPPPPRTDTSSLLEMELGGNTRPANVGLSTALPPVTGNGVQFPDGGLPPLPPSAFPQAAKPVEFIVPLVGPKKPEKPDASKFKRKSTPKDYFIYGCAILLLLGCGAGLFFYILNPEAAKSVLSGTKAQFDKAVQLPAAVQAVSNSSIEAAKGIVAERQEAKASPLAEITNNIEKVAEPAKEAAGVNTASSLVTTPPIEKKSDSTANPSTLPPVASAVTPSAKNAPQPNSRFLRYAEALVVSGVFQGEPARALVDGRIIRSGDLIEPMLAVTFVGVDANTRQLILEDKSGAQVRVRY